MLAVALTWILDPRSHRSPAIRSLAVRPLENPSADAAPDYFAEGMTDELITRLAQISAVHEISRTSVMTYKSADVPARDCT
jgi:TolB-like protein